MNSFTILFKPVSSSCQLDCKYCYYKKNRSKALECVSMELIDNLARVLKSLAPKTHLSFIWHGGEPLLSGLDLFEKITRKINDLAKHSEIEVHHGIQTNGILLNDAWCDLFKAFKISVGLSLDGPAHLHNVNRKYFDGGGSFEAVMKGIALLRSHGINFGVLSTITKTLIGHEQVIFDFFIKENISRFDFLPCFFTGDPKNGEISILPEEWSIFMRRVFEIWFGYDDPKIEVRFFQEIIKGLLGGKPTLCSLADNCERFFTIEKTGNVYPCDDFALNDKYLFGNLFSRTDNPIISQNAPKKKFRKIRDDLQKKLECHSCGYFSVCGGGCRRHKMLGKQVCHARKEIFSVIENNLKTTLAEIKTIA